MIGAFSRWLDDRTGYRALVRNALYERVPGGARWRYVWGSTLVFAFVVQLVTGLILWTAYSPSSQTAWESVYYIQHAMTGGWLLRGVHHFMAQAMIVLLAVHLLQVVVDGAYRAPREINFWLGLVLMKIVLGLSLTGYLLPWDQKGYWATKVATNMVALVPWVGDDLQRLLVGGPDYGHHTLTRFFALHAGLLPGLLVLFLVLHVALFRRHGLKAKQPHRGTDTTFWPDQVLRDAVVCLGVMAVVLFLVFRQLPDLQPGQAASDLLGAELSAPANPAENYSAARPEWYFLFLFQSLKYLQSFPPIVGALVVPGLVMASLFLMPIVGRWQLGHRFNVVWTCSLLVGAAALTALAWHDDHNGTTEHSQHYLASVAAAEYEAERAVELAGSPTGIPKSGALDLLADDPLLQGPKLFAKHCLSCHSYVDRANQAAETNLVSPTPAAPNLFGVGSRDWVAHFLDPEEIVGPDVFGYPNSPFVEEDRDGMVDWVLVVIGEVEPEEREELTQQIDKVVLALAAQSGRPDGQQATEAERQRIAEGVELIREEIGCTDCHKFQDIDYEGSGPDLTDYMSRQWLLDFVRNPASERFYGEENDRMPAFAPHDDPQLNQLDDRSLELIVDWLRGDWYRAKKPQ